MRTEYLIQLIKEDKLMKFYKSKEWNALRLIAIRRAKNECEHCKRNGKVTTRETLDKRGRKMKMDVNHIKPVKTHPHLALDLDNLEYLCVRCHNIADGKDKMISNSKPKFTNEERW
ncbi:TPA: HNH endonuclease [Bacillus cereus]|uniref:HNH endonuclease n=1 Tax=Bacillus cereus TaxID=1396 RepID=UPI001926D66F|nr:HNH endonuclease [Bacillus cereus]MBL3768865.1 HNH endonuclease [Bacillus cereus]MBL3774703.1 HNH endonuclease [Bacillus cereus]MBL3780473.1 HNH endonuclease [Bacillus cereus]MBL3791738.1 HNH endonuclease [Bacillus cereus]